MCEVWFWQLIISPHMSDLAVALAGLGVKVTYVAEAEITEDRLSQGWSAKALPGVTLKFADSDEAVAQLVQSAPLDAVHICQGVRANARVGLAQRSIAARGLAQWVVMETVNDKGLVGALKRLLYQRLLGAQRDRFEGVLATGYRTPDWVVARGIDRERVFPFAYFLPNSVALTEVARAGGAYRFLFVGRLIPLKRVDWLIDALSELCDHQFELWIVGAGEAEHLLRAQAEKSLAGRVRWFGQLPLVEVPSVMVQADCLVLPSIHDGWGAVASEALMTGTRVISSEACGVADVVRASGVGGVFPTASRRALKALLLEQLLIGPVTALERRRVGVWASCLSASSGAAYLKEILTNNKSGNGTRAVVPWLKGADVCVD
jgi:glycosyltransferase involved in cell wall biosynthesis